MRKSLVLGAAVVGFGLILGGLKVWADGSFAQAPGPQISATGQNYAWPVAASPQPGGVLVNDGVGTFRWTTAPVASPTTSLTALQLLTLSSMTVTQINTSTAAAVAQIVICGNCTTPFAMCISTSTNPPGAGSDFILSTGTICK